MKKIRLSQVNNYVEENIGTFHQKSIFELRISAL